MIYCNNICCIAQLASGRGRGSSRPAAATFTPAPLPREVPRAIILIIIILLIIVSDIIPDTGIMSH